METNHLFVHLGGSTWRFFLHWHGVLFFKEKPTINSLGNDGVIVSLSDYNKFEALIGDYFEDTNESGCEDKLECGEI